MKKLALLPAFLLLLAVAACAQAQSKEKDISGDWLGTLHQGAAELRLVLHVSKASGGYVATLDSPDQNANGIPVNSISLQAGVVNFLAEAAHGSYSGKLNAEGSEIDGSWIQGRTFVLNFKRSTAPPKTTHAAATPSELDGDWQGTLDTGSSKLRLVLHITNTTGGLTATLDSLDQGATGIPATSFTRDNSAVVIEFKQIAGKFSGNAGKHFMIMEGTWTQGGGTLPLTLQHVKK